MAGTNVVQAIGPTYHLADVKAAVQSSINCFPRKISGDVWEMMSAEGSTDIVTLPAGVRGARYVEPAGTNPARWFVAAGNVLYAVNTDGTYVTVGNLAGGSTPVSMSNNLDSLVVVDGANLWVVALFDLVMTQVTVDGWRGSDNVDEMDGYFIFAEPGSDQFYISGIDDPTRLDALDFSSADALPDKIVAHTVNHHTVFFFGTKSTEIWVDSGGADFPFTRYNSYPIDIGIVGPYAFVNAADTVYFVGKTDRGKAIVYELNGNRPVPISNSCIEGLLLGSTDISLTELFTWQPKGSEFVCINAPGINTTLVYDAKAKQWHERGEWVDGEWTPLKWRFVTSIGTQFYGGDTDGKLFRVDETLNQISGRTMVRERTWPHLISPELEPVSYKGLEISCKTGYGGNITLQISNDGGNNFGPALLRSLGTIGRWMQRVRWLNLGSAVNRVFRLRCSDNVPFVIYLASVDA